jgi:DNA-binding Lrp family transcriptional regulator
MKAYVLINVRAGKSRNVEKQVRQIAGVKSAHTCWGRPDVFAFVEVANEIALSDTVLAKIQTLDGIESTDTHIVIE